MQEGNCVMDKQSDSHAMTGNVQGFDLPRGCLMTTGLILLPIVTVLIWLLP